jgi:hypothetical protein
MDVVVDGMNAGEDVVVVVAADAGLVVVVVATGVLKLIGNPLVF